MSEAIVEQIHVSLTITNVSSFRFQDLNHPLHCFHVIFFTCPDHRCGTFDVWCSDIFLRTVVIQPLYYFHAFTFTQTHLQSNIIKTGIHNSDDEMDGNGDDRGDLGSDPGLARVNVTPNKINIENEVLILILTEAAALL